MTEVQLYKIIKNGNGKINPQLRLRILRRDNYTCQSCHRSNVTLQVDHIIPRNKGGLDGLQNLKTICYDCHIEKHQWDYIERETSRMVWSEFDKVFDPN
jgi:5-methylcytosine-specific restriction endonuclease McrA